MKCRKFTLDDLIAFAELSGDYNPMHIDPVAARRLIFGSPVVHGIYSVLWGLDCWLEGMNLNVELRSIKAIFPKSIRVDEEAALLLEDDHAGNLRIELYTKGELASILEIEWIDSEQNKIDCIKAGFPDKHKPCILSEDEMQAISGNLKLYLNIDAAARIFPHLTRHVSPLQIAVFLASTRLVGIEYPGLRSIYSELKLVAGDSKEQNSLQYKFKKYDKRFNLVIMDVIVPGMTGYIKAFIRPEHQEQAGFLKLKEVTNKDEFAGQRALIIGGSRGLGEVAAKLLAAGAAEVKVTYHKGEEDAEQIVKEINSNGGIADCLHFDVLSQQKDYLSELLSNWPPTHLYYLATPFIASGAKGVFSTNLFNKFCDYYITGFLSTINQLRSLGLSNVFYPSTVFIDELPVDMGEYAAAKAAGEMLCMFLNKSNKDLSIHSPRLPKVSTDQTVSLLPVKKQDPVQLMLEHLRIFRDMSA